MAGITGKEALSIKKLDVQESKVPAIGFNKIRFAHKATAGSTSISLTALTTPTEMIANGFVQPNLSVLSQLSLAQFRENFTLRSSIRGPLMEYLSYTLAGAQKINLTFSAEDGEIFEGIFDYVPRTGNTLVDASPLVVTGTLSAGTTDFNVGTPFEVGLYSSQQVGAVMVFVDNQIAYRNTSNQPIGSGIQGDYYEVHAGGGLGTLIRFNTADPVNDRGVIVVSVGALSERPNGAQLALIEALSGKVDNMIPTLAALAGVSVSSFGSYPSNVDLKAFGDRVLTNESNIALKRNKAGVTDGSAGTAGEIGELIQSSGQNQLINTVLSAMGSITLTPGVWDISAAFYFNGSNANTLQLVISTTSGSTAGSVNGLNNLVYAVYNTGGAGAGAIPPYEVNITSTTTYFLNAKEDINSSATGANWSLRARRVR